MDGLVSGVTRSSGILSHKNEEDGQRVKRRRMMRKCHSDGVRFAKKFAIPGHCGIYDL
jgi:hypothetical protein